jgi:hypothetical protein
MNKLESEGKELMIKAKEAGASAKTSNTTCSDMKKKVDEQGKKLAPPLKRL